MPRSDCQKKRGDGETEIWEQAQPLSGHVAILG